MSAALYRCSQCRTLLPLAPFLGQVRHMCYVCSAVHVVYENGDWRCAIPKIDGKRYELHCMDTLGGEVSMWYAGETIPPRPGMYETDIEILKWDGGNWYTYDGSVHMPQPHKWRGIILNK